MYMVLCLYWKLQVITGQKLYHYAMDTFIKYKDNVERDYRAMIYGDITLHTKLLEQFLK